ncbi:MAG: hypothetical protein Q4A74_04400 [Cardiobacteriaceae bacterium]|nr:hypothetical protein [Cardiobacteriaceae bacterium]
MQLPDEETLRFDQPTALDASALHISEWDGFVEVILRHNQHGSVHRARARHVISGMPLMIAARIVDNPIRYGLQATGAKYALWLVSNFLLHRPLIEHKGEARAWDNVIYDSPALGYISADHQQLAIRIHERRLLTTYYALTEAQYDRQWLLNVSADEFRWQQLTCCTVMDGIYGALWRMWI